MVDFKRSFNELKRPIVWLHYALGAGAIIGIYQYLLNQPLFALSTQAVLMYYAIYIVVDRAVHGLLELF